MNRFAEMSRTVLRGTWLRRQIRHKCLCSVLMVVGFTGTHVTMACALCATKTPYSGRKIQKAAGPSIQCLPALAVKENLVYNRRHSMNKTVCVSQC
ncbi:hypothetical protein cypCar_00045168 [Cyprinus carpio]|nr:hypothetical protein cypCar_00045168 [Cyprinus carpio]